ncbi:NUDIX hydrolase [Gordonia sp. DT30]|uniref:NUDIX hydrolase n=1 Tax=Gordonia sp. DT30 TaxID=3416546 RepID=UPI003CEBF998
MTDRILAVGAVVRDDDGRFLLVQRGREPQAGLWSVPGGKVEPPETLPQAVIREIGEETGIEVEVGREVWALDIPDGRGAIFEVHDFVAVACTTDVVAGDDAADAGWFSPEEMRALPLTPGLVEHLLRHGLL